MVSFDLCDSITEFVLNINAFTHDSVFGIKNYSFYSKKPFYVDSEVPNALLRNDLLNLNVALYNKTNDAIQNSLDIADNKSLTIHEFEKSSLIAAMTTSQTLIPVHVVNQ